MLFGRPLRDHLPNFNRKLRPEWDVISDAREMALAKRVTKAITDNGRELEPLRVGDCVQVQNQTGNHPNKWTNTGVIADALPNRQYHVIMDGSRRVSLRNRRFLRKILPICRKKIDLSSDGGVPVPPVVVNGEPDSAHVDDTLDDVIQNLHTVPTSPMPEEVSNVQDVADSSPSSPPLRRSGRSRVPRTMFSAKLSGKSHE